MCGFRSATALRTGNLHLFGSADALAAAWQTTILWTITVLGTQRLTRDGPGTAQHGSPGSLSALSREWETSRRSNVDIVRLLLDHGADPNRPHQDESRRMYRSSRSPPCSSRPSCASVVGLLCAAGARDARARRLCTLRRTAPNSCLKYAALHGAVDSVRGSQQVWDDCACGCQIKLNAVGNYAVCDGVRLEPL